MAPFNKEGGILTTRNAFENNSAQISGVLEQLKSDNSKLLAKHEAAGKALEDINLNIVSLDKSIKDKEVAVAAYSAVLDSRSIAMNFNHKSGVLNDVDDPLANDGFGFNTPGAMPA